MKQKMSRKIKMTSYYIQSVQNLLSIAIKYTHFTLSQIVFPAKRIQILTAFIFMSPSIGFSRLKHLRNLMGNWKISKPDIKILFE